MDRTEAIADLSPLYAEAVRLHDEGHDGPSIATHLGVAPESVAALLDIAEAKLARLLREDTP